MIAEYLILLLSFSAGFLIMLFMCVARVKRGSGGVEKWRLDDRPVSRQDIDIINATLEYFSNESNWQHQDDRLCVAGRKQTLFCAIVNASREISGKYKHRGSAVHEVRRCIAELYPNRWQEHPVMDFNNNTETTFADVRKVLQNTLERLNSRV